MLGEITPWIEFYDWNQDESYRLWEYDAELKEITKKLLKWEDVKQEEVLSVRKFFWINPSWKTKEILAELDWIYEYIQYLVWLSSEEEIDEKYHFSTLGINDIRKHTLEQLKHF